MADIYTGKLTAEVKTSLTIAFLCDIGATKSFVVQKELYRIQDDAGIHDREFLRSQHRYFPPYQSIWIQSPSLYRRFLDKTYYTVTIWLATPFPIAERNEFDSIGLIELTFMLKNISYRWKGQTHTTFMPQWISQLLPTSARCNMPAHLVSSLSLRRRGCSIWLRFSGRKTQPHRHWRSWSAYLEDAAYLNYFRESPIYFEMDSQQLNRTKNDKRKETIVFGDKTGAIK